MKLSPSQLAIGFPRFLPEKLLSESDEVVITGPSIRFIDVEINDAYQNLALCITGPICHTSHSKAKRTGEVS